MFITVSFHSLPLVFLSNAPLYISPTPRRHLSLLQKASRSDFTAVAERKYTCLVLVLVFVLCCEALLQEFPSLGLLVPAAHHLLEITCGFCPCQLSKALGRPCVGPSPTMVLSLALQTYSDSLPCWAPQVPRLSLTHVCALGASWV